MKIKSILLLFTFGILGLVVNSYNQNRKENTFSDQNTHQNNIIKEEVLFKDYEPQPTLLDIETYISVNSYFRRALWAGSHFQVTLMFISIGNDIGLGKHFELD